MKAIILYMPTIHQGYLNFLKRHQSGVSDSNKSVIFLIDMSLIKKMAEVSGREYLLRSFHHAVDSSEIKTMLECSIGKHFLFIQTINQYSFAPHDSFVHFIKWNNIEKIVMPGGEDLTDYFTEDYLKPLGLESKVDMSDKSFVRSNNLIPQNEAVNPDIVMSNIPSFLKEVAKIAYKEADRSSDWWRQVGAVLFNDKEEILLVGFNKHLPDEHIPNIYGDFRAFLNAGSDPDWGTALHAERMIFGKALKKGISTDGLSLYVTTYPCSGCAAVISQTGIKRIYYTEGYSMAEQAGSVMKAFGIEVIHIPKEVIEK